MMSRTKLTGFGTAASLTVTGRSTVSPPAVTFTACAPSALAWKKPAASVATPAGASYFASLVRSNVEPSAATPVTRTRRASREPSSVSDGGVSRIDAGVGASAASDDGARPIRASRAYRIRMGRSLFRPGRRGNSRPTGLLRRLDSGSERGRTPRSSCRRSGRRGERSHRIRPRPRACRPGRRRSRTPRP